MKPKRIFEKFTLTMMVEQMDETDFEYLQIIPESELPTGERIFIEIDGSPIMLLNQNGTIFAISDFCTHDHGSLGDAEVSENMITCPRHGARFDLHTGKALSLPAIIDIPVYKTRVKNNYIEIGVKKTDNRET